VKAGLCKICKQPMTGASMGGPNVCVPCDIGKFRDGSEWEYKHASNNAEVAKRAAEIAAGSTSVISREECIVALVPPPRCEICKTPLEPYGSTTWVCLKDGCDRQHCAHPVPGIYPFVTLEEKECQEDS
jgi:hypothetical protein